MLLRRNQHFLAGMTKHRKQLVFAKTSCFQCLDIAVILSHTYVAHGPRDVSVLPTPRRLIFLQHRSVRRLSLWLLPRNPMDMMVALVHLGASVFTCPPD